MKNFIWKYIVKNANNKKFFQKFNPQLNIPKKQNKK